MREIAEGKPLRLEPSRNSPFSTEKMYTAFSPEERINNRIAKFDKMGFWDELAEEPAMIHHGEPEPEINEIIPVNHE